MHFSKLKIILYVRIYPWRRIEVVITSSTRNRVVLTGTWVRIPPSPPFRQIKRSLLTIFTSARTFYRMNLFMITPFYFSYFEYPFSSPYLLRYVSINKPFNCTLVYTLFFLPFFLHFHYSEQICTCICFGIFGYLFGKICTT